MKRRTLRWLSMGLLCCMLAAGVAQAASVSYGSTGSDVTRVQTRLKQYGYLSGTADGVFGNATLAAVQWFQRKNGLTPDGVVGSATAAALGITLSGGSGTKTTGQTTDVDLLARAVHGEARGEPYTGMVAVASVILNRVKHPSFPNSIAGVIYQPGAFDVVTDGQINLTPSAQAYKAARDAMNGWDPTNGCIYYYNPSRANSKWIFTRPVRLAIGNHVFCA